MEIPRKRVKRLLQECAGLLSNQHGLAINPISLDAIFDVKLTSKLDLEISPLLRTDSEKRRSQIFSARRSQTFSIWGPIYYIKELNLLAEDRYPEPPPKSFANQ